MGIFIALALIGASFVSFTRVDQSASQNNKEDVEAKMVAQAGVEVAIAQLQEIFREVAYSDERNKSDSEKTSKQWVYRSGETSEGEKQTWSTPLEHAKIPSFPNKEKAFLGSAANDKFSYSGYPLDLDKDKSPQKQYYTLRVRNANSMININDSDENGKITKLLDNLCQVVKLGDPSVIAAAIVNNRPKPKSPSKEPPAYQYTHDLVRLGILKPEEYDKIKDFITADSWTDEQAVKPGHFPDGVKIERRSPIDLNTAPATVLKAVLRGISGKSIDNKSVSFPNNLVDGLVNEIINQRRNNMPFRSWPEFDDFLKKQVKDELQAELIYANANPNVHLNDRNPDSNLYRKIDKLDLQEYTTEFCLGPMGIFEIESLGRVVRKKTESDKNPTSLRKPTNVSYMASAAKIRYQVKIFEVRRHTMQKEWEGARQSRKDRESRDGLPPRSFHLLTGIGDKEKSHSYVGSLFRGNPTEDCTYSNSEENKNYSDGAYTDADSIVSHDPFNVFDGHFSFFFKPSQILNNGDPHWILHSQEEALLGLFPPMNLVTGVIYQPASSTSSRETGTLRVFRTLTYAEKDVDEKVSNGYYKPVTESESIRLFRGAPMHPDFLERLFKHGEEIYRKNLKNKKTALWKKKELEIEEGRQLFGLQFMEKVYDGVRTGDPNFNEFKLWMIFRLKFYVWDFDNWEWDKIYDGPWAKEVTIKVTDEIYKLIYDVNNELWTSSKLEKVHKSRDENEQKILESREVKDATFFEKILSPLPFIHLHRFSRHEKQIPVNLNVREWYHIDFSWEGVQLTDFNIKGHKLNPQPAEGDIVELSGNPLSIWRDKEERENKLKFQSPGTVFNAEIGDHARYKDTTITGEFDLSSSRKKQKFYFGTIRWTGYHKFPDAPDTTLSCQASVNGGAFSEKLTNQYGEGQKDLQINSPVEKVDYQFTFQGPDFRTPLLEEVTLNLFMSPQQLSYEELEIVYNK